MRQIINWGPQLYIACTRSKSATYKKVRYKARPDVNFNLLHKNVEVRLCMYMQLYRIYKVICKSKDTISNLFQLSNMVDNPLSFAIVCTCDCISYTITYTKSHTKDFQQDRPYRRLSLRYIQWPIKMQMFSDGSQVQLSSQPDSATCQGRSKGQF